MEFQIEATVDENGNFQNILHYKVLTSTSSLVRKHDLNNVLDYLEKANDCDKVVQEAAMKINVDETGESTALENTATRGGIDLNSKNMAMSVDGEKIDIKFDPAMIEQFKRGDFSGVRPVIINITPIPSILPLLGLKEEENPAQLAHV